MKIDKTWMEIQNRRDTRYEKGVCEFLEFAFNKPHVQEARCPCKKCLNNFFRPRDEIYDHLIAHRIDRNYKRWHLHGESLHELEEEEDDDYNFNRVQNDNFRDMIYDIGQASGINLDESGVFMGDQDRGQYSEKNHDDSGIGMEEQEKGHYSENNLPEELDRFYRLLKDVEQELYPNCESFSKLSFILELLNVKCLYGISNKAFDKLLEIMRRALPRGNKVPNSFYDARKITRDLGLDYEKIDACENDCMLFWKENASLDNCLHCGTSRWVEKNNGSTLTTKHRKKKKNPRKVLRYFPLTPRLQRLYMSKKIAEEMRWHSKNASEDGCLRHPVDSLAWKSFDSEYPEFAADPRNIRLGLASDGFNPFANMNVNYSSWPVILFPYNLPPWMCMKSPYFMMSLLIPGPKSPGNDIDVYLEPLVDELRHLWEVGVETYDAFSKQSFRLHAAVLWTVNDFPAYANLSGWSTKGYLACPSCHIETCSIRLNNWKKEIYMGSRRYLPENHPWRNNANAFDGNRETRNAPTQLSGDDIVDLLKDYKQVKFGKKVKKRKRADSDALPGNWTKKSIFFQLPYWRKLKLRHNLDPMHIEKNVCDSLVGTLMNLEGKTKDNLNTRFDLQDMGIRKELHPIQLDNGKYVYKDACYTMSVDEKKAFCQFLIDLKVPDGYASNTARYVDVNSCKISGMKCHDCHIFLHQYLPLAIRGVLQKEVCDAIIRFCTFLRELWSKTLSLETLEGLEKSIAITLCEFEKIFPPSFFDIMVHVTIHLATEAKLGGPLRYRSMYSIERYLRMLKSFVKNKARVEGSIAESYLLQECVTFSSRYLGGETLLNRVQRNYDGVEGEGSTRLSVFRPLGRALSGKTFKELTLEEREQVTMYVLKNCEEISVFLRMHIEELTGESTKNVEMRHEKEFPCWFKRHVSQLMREGNANISDELLALAKGPDLRVYCYSSYYANGWRFCTKQRDTHLRTQNSGLLVKGDESTGHMDYYGVLTDIIELDYSGQKVLLFKGDWWDVYNEGKGYKEDRYGYVMVNVTRKLKTNEHYVLASQAQQVFYVKDIKEKNWQVVVRTQPRDSFDMPIDHEEEDKLHQQEAQPIELLR